MAYAIVVTVATPGASYAATGSPDVDYTTTGFKATRLVISVSGVAGTDTVAFSFDGVNTNFVLGVGTHQVPGSLCQKIWVKKLGGAPTSCSIAGSNTT